jgi:hypothetical protein
MVDPAIFGGSSSPFVVGSSTHERLGMNTTSADSYSNCYPTLPGMSNLSNISVPTTMVPRSVQHSVVQHSHRNVSSQHVSSQHIPLPSPSSHYTSPPLHHIQPATAAATVMTCTSVGQVLPSLDISATVLTNNESVGDDLLNDFKFEDDLDDGNGM